MKRYGDKKIIRLSDRFPTDGARQMAVWLLEAERKCFGDVLLEENSKYRRGQHHRNDKY